MERTLRLITRVAVLALVVSTLTPIPASAEHGSALPVEAFCLQGPRFPGGLVYPDGPITLSRGDPLAIRIGFEHNDQFAASLYGVTFTATVSNNLFIPAGILYQQTLLAGQGAKASTIQDFPFDTSVMPLATNRVLISITSSETGSTVLGSCDFTLTVVDPAQDTDGDGLLNGWETAGLDVNNDGTIDLALSQPPYGARWDHKDLFVEIDFMNSALAGSDCGALPSCSMPAQHSHQPRADALQDVIDIFSAAPVGNPDGTTGISLHAMVDEAVAEHQYIKFQFGSPGVANDFDDIKLGAPAVVCDGSFGTTAERLNADCENILAARRKVFRYAIFGHTLIEAPGALGVAELPGNDLLMTLDTSSVSPPIQSGGLLQATTFLHEFGHTLGLGHGGADGINCKPNYISAMNYAYDDQVMDYSRKQLDPLNEQNLSEPAGVGGPSGVLAYYGVDGASRSSPADGPIDWNGNGAESDTGVNADVNYDKSEHQASCGPSPDQTALQGYDDWANLLYDFRQTRDYADNIRVSPHTTPDQSVEDFEMGFDADNDGIKDGSDNCLGLSNADQANHDTDSAGDACDLDDDNDNVLDAADNCPVDANFDQADLDADGAGDVCDPRNTIVIDVLPGKPTNPISLSSSGKVPVAILSTALFDASRVVRASPTFGRTGDEASLYKCSGLQDVNGDSRLDLVCHFFVRKTEFLSTDTLGKLKASLTNGIKIEGSDPVRIRP
jgi:hypothetical protein